MTELYLNATTQDLFNVLVAEYEANERSKETSEERAMRINEENAHSNFVDHYAR